MNKNTLFFETLDLRHKFEDMTLDFKFLDDNNRSDINTLKWFGRILRLKYFHRYQ